MCLMTDVWAAKRKNREAIDSELARPVPTGWTENGTEEFQLPTERSYGGPGGGGQAGATWSVKQHCTSLFDLLFFYFTKQDSLPLMPLTHLPLALPKIRPKQLQSPYN